MRKPQQKKSGLNEADWQRLREEIKPVLEEIVENTKPVWVDKLLTAADKAAGDYKKFDEEKTILSGQVEELISRVDKLDKHFQVAS